MSYTLAETADTLYRNGRIYTVDGDFTIAQAFCVRDDRFLAVGTEEEMAVYCTPQTKTVDLQGMNVLPGLIDSHLHVIGTGEVQKRLYLMLKTKDEILSMVQEAAQNSNPGEWIIGQGWDQSKWAVPEFPSMEDLDSVSPNNPVYLRRACGHASWANSLAFEAAGVDANTEDPVGGEVLRRDNGDILGVVTDAAQSFFNSAIPPMNLEQLEELSLLAQGEFFRNGLTSVHDMGADPVVIGVWEKLASEDKLQVRIYSTLRVPGRPTADEIIETMRTYFSQGIKIGLYNNRVTARAFKLSSDGSLGARSAWMLEEYSDRPGHCGNGKLTDEELYTITREARKAGYQMVVHCIGDASNRQCIDIYERVLSEMPGCDHRYRIEHAQIVEPSDIPRFAQLGIIPTFQSIHMATDRNFAEDRIGDRMKGAYAWRTFIEAGSTILPNGTDSPVEPAPAFPCMYSAVSRKDLNGLPENGWYAEEALTREEALRSYTIWGAFAAFEEELKGSIERGKLADFIVIDRDFMSCPEDEIKDITVLKTIVGGQVVYEKP